MARAPGYYLWRCQDKGRRLKENRQTQSHAQHAVVPMQVVTVFIGSFIVGSFFTNFQNWIKDPSKAATILGTAAPLQSIFFLNYIMFNVRVSPSAASAGASRHGTSHCTLEAAARCTASQCTPLHSRQLRL